MHLYDLYNDIQCKMFLLTYLFVSYHFTYSEFNFMCEIKTMSFDVLSAQNGRRVFEKAANF